MLEERGEKEESFFFPALGMFDVMPSVTIETFRSTVHGKEKEFLWKCGPENSHKPTRRIKGSDINEREDNE